MALIVQKYGGTSVGSPERIRNVARRVARYKALGHQVVVVVSAMSGETNRLIGLAKEIMPEPDPRELDQMVSTGEQVTIALTAMGLMDLGVRAKSYTGSQVRILTDDAHTKARILSIDEASSPVSARKRNGLPSFRPAAPFCTVGAVQNDFSASRACLFIFACSYTLVMMMYQEPMDMITRMVSVVRATMSPPFHRACRP